MKKLLIVVVALFSLAACSNPEDSANNNTDSAKNPNTEGNTLNSPPGPTTKDTGSFQRMDSSNGAANGMGSKATTGRAGVAGSGNVKDSAH